MSLGLGLSDLSLLEFLLLRLGFHGSSSPNERYPALQFCSPSCQLHWPGSMAKLPIDSERLLSAVNETRLGSRLVTTIATDSSGLADLLAVAPRSDEYSHFLGYGRSQLATVAWIRSLYSLEEDDAAYDYTPRPNTEGVPQATNASRTAFNLRNS
ncbi:hypothetical protein C8R43DRAFT_1106555 [Mycena crocata]|nr:hypothetical protein C8R43DRAFT_1106555 [Mycena crocata]